MLAYLLKLTSAAPSLWLRHLMALLISVPFLSRGNSSPNKRWERELSSQHCHPGIPLRHCSFHVKLADIIIFGAFLSLLRDCFSSTSYCVDKIRW